MLYVGQNKYTHRSWRYIGGSKTVMGNLNDDVILLIRPESFRGCSFVQTREAFVIENSLEYERKNEKDSGRSSKMSSSCKWPINSLNKVIKLQQNIN